MKGRKRMSQIHRPVPPVQELPSAPPVISGSATSVAAFVGSAACGPTDRAVLVRSRAEFTAAFGELLAGVPVGYAVQHFFDNGGEQAWIVRLATGADGAILQPGDGLFEQALTAQSASTPSGLHLLDSIAFNLLCVPAETDATAIDALQQYCAGRRAFLIVDAPQSATTALLSSKGPVASDLASSLAGAGAVDSAYYFPWVLAPDPLHPGQSALFPPCGFIAGIYAATDARRGVWKAPAGSEAVLKGAVGLQCNLTDEESAQLTAQAVNCLRLLPNAGTVVWGARTLAGADGLASEWKYVSIRRLQLFIESSIDEGTRWAVFEPNTENLWSRLRLTVGSFLEQLFRQGALQGTKPEQAYFVKCGSDTMTQADIDRGIVNIEIGFAPLRPAEFSVIRIQQIVGQSSS
jgi:phage tail sheath protein FI